MNTIETPAPAIVPAPAATWYDGVDTETVGYIQNRGLDKGDAKAAFLNAAKAHREAERLLGAGTQNLVRVPKDDNDVETRNALFNRIGRPADANGYDYTGVEGVDADFTKFVNPIFHANGVTKSAAKEIVKSILGEATRAQGEVEKAESAAYAVEKNALLANWGGATNANLIVAQNTYAKLGFTPEQVGAIEKQIGFAKTMTMFHNLGTKIGEDNFVNPNGPSGGPRITSKEQAVARKAELMADKDWSAKYLKLDAGALKEMTALNSLIASE
jgi:hypothetical protein